MTENETSTFPVENIITFGNLKMMFYVVVTLFVFTSITDVVTTYIGLSSGFVEQTAFVRMLWVEFNIFGLFISKIIALVAILVLGTPFYLFNRKMGISFLITTYGMGGILFGYATFHNMILLNMI